MKNSLSLGKVGGIQVYVHWTFPIILLWIIFSNLSRGLNTEQVTWSVLFILALFFCVILHEFGHALAAKRFQIHTKDITIYPIGGVARMEKMPEKPVQELIVALAGPAVNFLIVVILIIFLRLTKLPTDLSIITHVTPDNFLLSLAIVNGWLAVFNLIPAFPMDGGRVLRALLSLRLNRVKATKMAASVGQLIAILFVFFGFFNNPFLIFIGLFVFLGAMAEAEMVKNESILKGRIVEDLVMKEVPALHTTDTINKAVETLLNGQCKNFLVLADNRPAGTLNRDGIIKALQQSGGQTLLHAAMDENIGFIDAAEPAENAFMLLQQHKFPLLVVTKNEELYGVIDMENILEYIMVMNASSTSTNKY